MYLDVKGLVTSGIGNLLDPVALALSLPWKHTDGTPATQEEIYAEWGYVKSRKDMAKMGGGAFAKITKLRLSDADIATLVINKAREMEAYLQAHYPTYNQWPADAQLGLLSMAWAMGPAFHFPRFQAAVNRAVPDFNAASQQCLIYDPGNPIGGRNGANQLLFKNAATVLAHNLDPNTLYYPADLSAPT